jgi:hypothetical protein
VLKGVKRLKKIGKGAKRSEKVALMLATKIVKRGLM